LHLAGSKHGPFDFPHLVFFLTLKQSLGMQQLFKKTVPGSHCSPGSTMPFPQTGLGAPGGLIGGGMRV